MNSEIAAVFVEPIQGEGGVIPAEKTFLQGLRKMCTAHEALLVCDEVQTGLGRTGTLFAHERYEIEPDLMTLAKPLAGGLPIGAVLVREAVAQTISPGVHGTTFGGNPLVCRAALVVMNRLLQNGFLKNVRDRSQQLETGLHALAQLYPSKINGIRGQGLLFGIECHQPVGPVVEAAAEAGLLIISAGERYVGIELDG